MYTDGKLMQGTEQVCYNDTALSSGFLTSSSLAEKQAQILAVVFLCCVRSLQGTYF